MPEYRIEWLSGTSDLDAVQEIDRASFRAPWTRAMYEQELQNTGHAFIAVLRTDASAVAGYCAYRLVAGELQINNVAVRPECRGRGYGRALVEFALSHGRGAAADTAILDVRRSNHEAMRLYEGLGFVVGGERARYYSHPEEDALVMTLDVRKLEEDPMA